MKIIVVSDIHGRGYYLDTVMDRNPGFDGVFFLGDGETEILQLKEAFKDRAFICVKGNCDNYSQLSTEAYKHIEGVTFMACHGHRFSVKLTLRDLYNFAAGVRAHIALYGHTHKPMASFDPVTEVCAVNPGALCNGQYCVICVKNGKYDIFHKTV